MNTITARTNPFDMISELQPSAGVVAGVDQEGLVLFDTKRGVVFRSCSVGAFIWQCIVESEMPQAIATYLAARFALSHAAVAGDVDQFIRGLVAHELVTSASR